MTAEHGHAQHVIARAIRFHVTAVCLCGYQTTPYTTYTMADLALAGHVRATLTPESDAK